MPEQAFAITIKPAEASQLEVLDTRVLSRYALKTALQALLGPETRGRSLSHRLA